MMNQFPQASYGQVRNLNLVQPENRSEIVLEGIADDRSRFKVRLSDSAARMLWFYLTRYLFPEKSDLVTGLASTVRIQINRVPMVTYHVGVEPVAGGIGLYGLLGDRSWKLFLNDYEAHHFWTGLDVALYPVGWQGQKG